MDYTLPTTNIFFPEQQEPIYDTTDFVSQYQFTEYWKKEKDRCINGFYIADGKVKIPGKLYFHCVYGKIAAYTEKIVGGKERKVREIITPLLRDIDWDIFEDLERCVDEGKFYMLTGSRDYGKSVIAASCASWQYTFFSKSESIISSGAASYIKLATDKVEDFLLNIHPVFKKQRVASDWKKEIVAGWKDKRTGLTDPKSSQSSIKVRNYENGTNSMAAVGSRPGFHLIDESGTIENLIGCIKDSDGAWWSGGGNTPSCLVMVTGCVCKGTKVWTNNGKLINIEDLTIEDGLLGYSGKIVSNQTINWFKPPSIKECFRITTDDNNYIECSDDHPLLITRRKFYNYKDGGKIKRSIYQEAKNIQINDQILLPGKINIFGTKAISYARELGLMIGDGNYSYKSTPSLSVSEEEIYNYITNKYKKITFSNEYEISEGKMFSQINLKELKPILVNHKMYGQSKCKKRLPFDIYTFDKESVAELIGGYFDADGNVYYNEKKKIVRIVLTGVVYELLEEVKYQLTKFGIQSQLVKENRNTKPSEEYKGQKDYIYRLYINQQQDILLFSNNINFLVKSKQDNLSLVKYSKYQLFDTQFEINPLNNKEGYFEGGDLENLRYVTVKKIEYIGEREVYNLNCGPNHNYVSNGFITRQTGGDMDIGAEAGEVFFTPEAYNMLSFPNPEQPGSKMGRFVSALRAKMKYKEPKTLSQYLGIQHPDLDKITILVSNEETCLKEWWEPEYKKALKSGNPKTITKFLAYWPVKASDCFLVIAKNDFNIQSAKAQQARLISVLDSRKEMPFWKVEFFHDGENLTFKQSDKNLITEFPVKTQNKDAPVFILEHPPKDIPFGLYVAGIDPYRHEEAEYSDSLGSVYIFKRIHEINSEQYQDMFVAWYTARPSKKSVWEEQARYLIKYYNARALCENDEMSFIDYMIAKGDGHYLVDQPEWLKEHVPNTSMTRKKGVSTAPKQIRNFLDSALKQYMDDVLQTDKDDKGSIIKERLGVTKIFDPMLLEEIIKYNKDKGNYDRIKAAELALAQARKMDPIVGASGAKDTRMESYWKRSNKKAVLFQPTVRRYTNTRKLFGR